MRYGKWDQNRLTSRKFLLAVAFYLGVMAAVFILATVFHLNGNSIVETGINAVRDVFIAWLAVQGVVDFIKPNKGDV